MKHSDQESNKRKHPANDNQAELTNSVYQELHKLAASRLAREQGPLTLQATALVHEAWLRLGGEKQPSWVNRAAFFSAAARTMRRILVDRARRRRSIRHGGDHRRVEMELWNWENLDAAMVIENDKSLIALDESLRNFSEVDPEATELIQLRYFGGVKVKEAAELLGLSDRTAERRLAYARAWLANDMEEGIST